MHCTGPASPQCGRSSSALRPFAARRRFTARRFAQNQRWYALYDGFAAEAWSAAPTSPSTANASARASLSTVSTHRTSASSAASAGCAAGSRLAAKSGPKKFEIISPKFAPAPLALQTW